MINALVTLYNPTAENIENILSISKQADRVFACDNSARDNTDMFVSCPDSVIYLAHKKNLGLPKAFNQVLKNEEYWTTVLKRTSGLFSSIRIQK